jgi:protein-tyrosine phosphatase
MRIAVVCLGNICRSPMAHVVLEQRLEYAGLDVEVVSAGTAGYHVGRPMDRRAAAALRAAGYDPSRHRARQFTPDWFEECDLVLAMDDDNLVDLQRLAGPHGSKLRMFRSFDPAGPGDVPDPYYGEADGFRVVLAIVERTADVIVADLNDRVTPA